MALGGTALLFFVVANTGKSWDYSCTVAFTHFVLTCIVTLDFPTNWIWWVTLLGCTFLMSSGGELSIYYLKDMKEIDVDH